MTADQPREDAIAAGPDAREAFIRRIVALTPGNFTDDFLFLLDRLDEARAAMTTPREDAIAALAEWPCQRYNPPHDCGVISGNAPLPCGPCTARAALTRTAPTLDVRVATVEAKFVQHMAESHGATTERRESQPAPADPTADPRAALAGHPSPDRGSGPWVLRLVCCGYDDGIERYATWDEADMFRQTYVTGPGGHDRAAILTRDLETLHRIVDRNL